MQVQLEDEEIAVIIDSLDRMREKLHAAGIETPNVDSAIKKVTSLVTPDTRRLILQNIP